MVEFQVLKFYLGLKLSNAYLCNLHVRLKAIFVHIFFRHIRG